MDECNPEQLPKATEFSGCQAGLSFYQNTKGGSGGEMDIGTGGSVGVERKYFHRGNKVQEMIGTSEEENVDFKESSKASMVRVDGEIAVRLINAHAYAAPVGESIG